MRYRPGGGPVASTPSSHRRPEVRPAHERALVGGQEERCGGDVLHASEPREGRARMRVREHLGRVRLVGRTRQDLPRRHRVHDDALPRVVDGDLARQLHDPALRDRVGQVTGRSDHAVLRGDGDDAPAGVADRLLLEHLLDGPLAGEEHAAQPDGHDRVPVGLVASRAGASSGRPPGSRSAPSRRAGPCARRPCARAGRCRPSSPRRRSRARRCRPARRSARPSGARPRGAPRGRRRSPRARPRARRRARSPGRCRTSRR